MLRCEMCGYRGMPDEFPHIRPLRVGSPDEMVGICEGCNYLRLLEQTARALPLIKKVKDQK